MELKFRYIVHHVQPVKEIRFWCFTDSNGIRIHNHLVRKRTLKHLTIMPVSLNSRVFAYELNGCGFDSRCCQLKLRMSRLFRVRGSLTFRQLYIGFTLKLAREIIIPKFWFVSWNRKFTKLIKRWSYLGKISHLIA